MDGLNYVFKTYKSEMSVFISTETAPAKPGAGKDSPQILITETGNRFGIWPEKPASPAPTLLFFGGSVEEMLADEYQRQCGNLLADKGYICVLVDAPVRARKNGRMSPVVWTAGDTDWNTTTISFRALMPGRLTC